MKKSKVLIPKQLRGYKSKNRISAILFIFKVMQVRQSVKLFDDFFTGVENLLSSRIFWFLIVFALNVIKGFGILIDNPLRSRRSVEKISETLIASLFLLFGMRNISVCARKVSRSVGISSFLRFFML